MSQKLTFSKVSVLSFSRKAPQGSVRVSCAPTKTVAKAMGWNDVPEWLKSSQPVGMLAASIVEIRPNPSDLEKHAVELKTIAVRDFEFVRVQVNKGKAAKKTPTFRTELHAVIDFVDITGSAKLERYMQTINNNDASMVVTYEKEAVQETIETPADSVQGELEEVVQDVKRRRATSKEED